VALVAQPGASHGGVEGKEGVEKMSEDVREPSQADRDAMAEADRDYDEMTTAIARPAGGC